MFHKLTALLLTSTILLVACTTKEEATKKETPSNSAPSLTASHPTEQSAPEKSVLQPVVEDSIPKHETETKTEQTAANPPLDSETLKDLKEKKDQTLMDQVIRTGSKVMLPITPQIQELPTHCAPTTVSMMLASRGIVADQHQLAAAMGTYAPFGTHNRDAIRVLNSFLFGYETPADGQAGYRLATVRTGTGEELRLFKERLKKNIDEGYPLYYTFDCAKVYPGFSGEHNAIGIGYELTADGTDIANLYYLDPSPNLQDPTYGGLKKISPEELLAAMLTCVEPNYGW